MVNYVQGAHKIKVILITLSLAEVKLQLYHYLYSSHVFLQMVMLTDGCPVAFVVLLVHLFKTAVTKGGSEKTWVGFSVF